MHMWTILLPPNKVNLLYPILVRAFSLWMMNTVLELVYAHVDNSIATEQSKSSLSHPSSGLFFMDDEYDFCQKDIAKGGELLSKMGGVSSQEETKEAT